VTDLRSFPPSAVCPNPRVVQGLPRSSTTCWKLLPAAVTILCMSTSKALVTSVDFSILAEAAGVALVYSFSPEGHYLASVTANVASLLAPVARLDEEMEARILAEDALATGLSAALESPSGGE